jgi:hypothetical protein
MEGPNSAENKKSIINNLALLEPRLDGIGVEISIYIAKHIHRMYTEGKQMAGLDASEIEKFFLDKVIPLKPRIKSIASPIATAELIFSLCEEVLDNSDTLRATNASSAAISSTATSSTATYSVATSSSLSAVASPAITPPAVAPPAVTPLAAILPAVSLPAATQSTTSPHSTAQQGAVSSSTATRPTQPLRASRQLRSSPYRLTLASLHSCLGRTYSIRVHTTCRQTPGCKRFRSQDVHQVRWP